MSNAEPANVVDISTRGGRGGQAAASLASLRARALVELEKSVGNVFDRADDTLFDMLNNVPPSDHQDYMDAMCELRLRRQDCLKAFRGHLEAAFQTLADGKPKTAEQMREAELGAGELSLVSENDLLQQLGARQVGQAVHRDFGPVLAQLNRRMGVVAGGLELTEESNPLGGEHIGEGFSQGMAACSIAVTVKMILFKLFEREILDRLQDVYAVANQQLIDAGVLPTLPKVPVLSPEALKRARSKSPRRPGGDEDSRQESAPGAESPAGDGADRGGYVLSADEHALFSSLHNMLQSYRQESRQTTVADEPGRRAMSSREVMAVLSLFQDDMP
ncbi:MAG: DUF1631 family protein, partial [Gammaproteobacteria bacterium]|nr:DUF1631 family protein [Gammaproteobacteria bacterium]